MVGDPPKPKQSVRPLGHPGRVDPETREMTLLVLGHFMVFVLSMAHDEIVAEMVADGWFLGRFAERFELLIGFVLFLCWGALTIRLSGLWHRVRTKDE